VQVRYDEGVAIHIGPEPCGDIREDGGEASAGERIGQPLSPENHLSRTPTRLTTWKAKPRARHRERFRGFGVVEDPGMCGSFLYGNREVSSSTGGRTPQVRIGKVRSRRR